jgi:ADP-heptose:LPS heptosyltransferase
VPEGHLALNPLSATPDTREWQGFAALAAAWDGPVVVYGGPGEAQRLHDVAQGLPIRCGLPLPELAGALRRAAVLVSVDTGPAHFARSLGVPTVVVHGGTDPARSAPAGSASVVGEAPCRPCHASHCRPRGCAPRACLDIPVGHVLAAAQDAAS